MMKKLFLLIIFILLNAFIVLSQDCYMYDGKGKKIYFKERKDFVAIKSLNTKSSIQSFLTKDGDTEITQITQNILLASVDSLLTRNMVYKSISKDQTILKVLEYEDGVLQIPLSQIFLKSKSLDIKNLLKKIGLATKACQIKEIDGPNKIYDITFSADDDPMEISRTIFESGLCEYAEPTFVRLRKNVKLQKEELFLNLPSQSTDNNILAGEFQWGLKNTGQYGGISGCDINVSDAWNITRGDPGVKIAVIDEGVDFQNPSLVDNLLYNIGYDATDNHMPGELGSCASQDSHGTACAGIIASTGKGFIGRGGPPIGIAPNCKIVPIRIAYTVSGYWITTDEWISNGLSWGANSADILSNSWGGGSFSERIFYAINNAVTKGRNGLGCVVVFAAGNDNKKELSFPASFDAGNPLTNKIISVGAISPCFERKSLTSCDGEYKWGSNYGTGLDIMAPGVLVPTTDLSGSYGYNPNDKIHIIAGGTKISNDYLNQDFTLWFNGTSAACPHVAGVAALMLSVNKQLSAETVGEIISRTARKVGNYAYDGIYAKYGNWDNEMGYGLIDAKAAVRYAILKKQSISGSSYIPSPMLTNEIYSIDLSFPDSEIQWTVSGNLQIISGQGTNEIQVEVNTDKEENASINLVIDGYSISKKIYIGMPPIISIIGPTELKFSSFYSTPLKAFYSCYSPFLLDNTWDDLGYVWTVEKAGKTVVESYTYENKIEISFENPGLYNLFCSSISFSSAYRGEPALTDITILEFDGHEYLMGNNNGLVTIKQKEEMRSFNEISPSFLSYKLYDINNVTIQKGLFDRVGETFNFSRLSKGIYFFKIEHPNNRTEMFKIII